MHFWRAGFCNKDIFEIVIVIVIVIVFSGNFTVRHYLHVLADNGISSNLRLPNHCPRHPRSTSSSSSPGKGKKIAWGPVQSKKFLFFRHNCICTSEDLSWVTPSQIPRPTWEVTFMSVREPDEVTPHCSFGK